MRCGFVSGEKRHFVANSYQQEKSLLFQKLRSGNGKGARKLSSPSATSKRVPVNTSPVLT